MSQEFFRDQHFFLLSVSRGSRGRKSALMARRLLCLAALSGQPPEPGGSRRKARGVDGESARRATIVSGHYAAYVFCVPDPLSLLKFFGQLTPRRSPFAMRRSPHQLISGRGEPRTKVPHATCEGTGLQGGWDPSATRLLSASHAHGHTSTLESVMLFSSSFSDSNYTFRMAPSGARPVSR